MNHNIQDHEFDEDDPSLWIPLNPDLYDEPARQLPTDSNGSVFSSSSSLFTEERRIVTYASDRVGDDGGIITSRPSAGEFSSRPTVPSTQLASSFSTRDNIRSRTVTDPHVAASFSSFFREPNAPSRRIQTRSSISTTALVSPLLPAGESRSVDEQPEFSSPGNGERESLDTMRRRLEYQATLRKGLIEHPLDQMGGILLRHIANELWNHDIHIRLGIVLVLLGLILQMIAFPSLIIHLCRPRPSTILPMLFLLSCLHLFRPYEKILSILNLLTSQSAMTEAIFKSMEDLDPIHFRRVCLCVAMVPTILEMTALIFLSKTIVECGWIINFLVTLLMSVCLMFLKKFLHISARNCSVAGLIFLYLSGLVLAFIHFLYVNRITAIGGPFLMAAGAFVISCRGTSGDGDDVDWLCRTVRRPLQFTLRDVLVSIGDKVAEDEMLRISMLRWLVDYWTYRPPTNTAHISLEDEPTNTAQVSSVDEPINTAHVSSVDETGTSASSNSQAQIISVEHPANHSGGNRPNQNSQTLEWPELSRMLARTTEQMYEEMNTDEPEEQDTDTYSTNNAKGNGSLDNLRAMLMSLDVDERAKPAVLSYKRSVEQIPPSREVAETIAVMRRCPAILSLLVLYLMGSAGSIPATLTLLPLVVLGWLRIQEWMESCNKMNDEDFSVESAQANRKTLFSPLICLPPDMDPMSILLSGDQHDPVRPSSSLQVWANVKDSVRALESGLTAVRCVHTTAVAVEFARNIMSLADLGMEVYWKGWLHGFGVIIRELVNLHTSLASNDNPETAFSKLRFTGAAVNVVRNGQAVSRNVRILLEEEGGNQFVSAVLDVLGSFVGRGWLWGRDENRDATESVGRSINLSGVVTVDSGGVDCGLAAISSLEVQGEVHPASERDCVLRPGSIQSDELTAQNESTSSNSVETTENNSVVSDVIGSHDEPKSSDEDSDMACLFDLITEALQRGMINEEEKNAFIQMLVTPFDGNEGVGTDSGANCSGSRSSNMRNSAIAVRKSLECLFAESNIHLMHEQMSASAPIADERDGEEKKSGCEQVSSWEGKKTRWTNSVSSPIDEDVSTSMAVNLHVEEDLVLDDDESSNLGSVSGPNELDRITMTQMKSARTELTEEPGEVKSDEKTRCGVMNSELGVDQTASIVPNNSAEDRCLMFSVPPSKAQVDDNLSGDKDGGGDNSSEASEETKTDDQWIGWVGGGFAVLGAVFGALVLAHGNKGGGNSTSNGTPSGGQERRPSVVSTKRVDDEDGDT